MILQRRNREKRAESEIFPINTECRSSHSLSCYVVWVQNSIKTLKFLFVCSFPLTITFSIITYDFMCIHSSSWNGLVYQKSLRCSATTTNPFLCVTYSRNYWINFHPAIFYWLLICIRLLIYSSRPLLLMKTMWCQCRRNVNFWV